MTIITHKLTHQPAVVSGIYDVGSIGDPPAKTLAVTVEVFTLKSWNSPPSKTLKLIVDHLPLTFGSPLHRLGSIVSGFTLPPEEVQARLQEILLGGAAELVFDGDHLVHGKTWPGTMEKRNGPAPGFVMMGPSGVVGAAGTPWQKPAEYPEPPTPSEPPRYWSVSELKNQTLPDLPARVAELVKSSVEFASLAPKKCKVAA